MKLKRFFANVVVLLIFAAVVFFAGWVQFAVKPGTCALMESKTSGLYEKPIVAGVFTWRWERLLPTNVKLTTFSLEAQKENVSASGCLPSGELYASFLPERAVDFSYSVEADVSLSFSAESVYSLFAQGKVFTDDDLKTYRAASASLFVSLLAQQFVETGLSPQNAALSQNEILSIIQKSPEDFTGVSIVAAEVTSSKIPDIDLYNKLKADCFSKLDLHKSNVEEKSQSQAFPTSSHERTIAQLERLGEVLSKYPQLEELLKTAEGIKLLNSINTDN